MQTINPVLGIDKNVELAKKSMEKLISIDADIYYCYHGKVK